MAEAERRLAAILFTDLVGYTALMGADEERAIETVEQSRALIRSRVEAHSGRCLEHEGDGTLSVFASAVESVAAALEILAEGARGAMRIHVGIHLGDVIESAGRVVGDGVNVAARVCALAPAGEIYVSEAVYDQIRNQRGVGARRIGAPDLKNVNRPITIWSVYSEEGSGTRRPARSRARGIRRALGAVAVLALAAVVVGAERIEGAAARVLVRFPGVFGADLDRTIAFAQSADGTRLAWASVGAGPPVVQIQVWWTNVEWGPIGPRARLPDFAAKHRIVYYDGRGFGLSQRDVVHSPERRLQDLEAVVAAADLDRFALWAISAGTPVAIAYAAAHPERVSHLILYGTALYQPVDDETHSATLALLRKHFGSTEPVFRDYFRGFFVPDASDFEMRVFAEFSKNAGDGENAAAVWETGLKFDVRPLARQVRAPTLVMHRRDDVLIPYQMGLEAAGLIPGARFESFEGRNHVFMPGEREGERSMDVIEAFIAAPTPAADRPGPRQ